MSTKTKKQASPKSAAGKRAAQIAKNKSARMQWFLLSGALGATIIGAVVLISVFTEGELPVYGGHGGA